MANNTSLLQDDAYQFLKGEIRDGKLDPGKVYSVREVAEKLHMSKTPVRDAVMKLSREDLLVILPSRGFRLPNYDAAEITELYQLRQALEGYAGALLAERYAVNPNLPEVAEMEKELAKQAEAVKCGVTAEEFYDIEVSFHQILFQSAKNRRINSILNNNARFYRDFAIRSLKDEGILERTLREHTAIVEAIKSGDPAKTWNEVTNHLRTPLGKNLKGHMEIKETILYLFPELEDTYAVPSMQEAGSPSQKPNLKPQSNPEK